MGDFTSNGEPSSDSGDLPQPGSGQGRFRALGPLLKDWLGERSIALITLCGIMAYIVLRLPYSVYYGTLGTSPEEAGLSYIELLTRSTLGVAAAAVSITALTIIVCSNLAWFYFYAHLLYILLEIRKAWRGENPETSRRAASELVNRYMNAMQYVGDLGDEEREEKRKAMIAYVLTNARRETRRETIPGFIFRKLREYPLARAMPGARTKAWRYSKRVFMVVAAFILFALPIAAYLESLEVKQCKTPILSRYGLFGFGGRLSTVTIAAEDANRIAGKDASQIANSRRSLMYLGTGTSHVFFDCMNRQLVRFSSDLPLIIVSAAPPG